MKPLNITTEQFISCLFEANDTVCLRVFSDRNDETFKGLKLEADAVKIEKMRETLEKHNHANRGIFFCVNSGGHNDADISRINAQFVESDEGTFEEQWERVGAFPLPPSLVVQTQKSLHCYWLVKNAEVGKFRKVQRQMVEQFNGDPKCVNESRVMRLPGYYHCKKDPVMVSVVLFAPERRYTQDELSAALPKIADETAAAASTTKGTRKGMTQVGKRCQFMRHCKENAATLSEHDWYAMISNLAVFDGGDKAIHALSRAYPKYNYAETQNKIAHFLESGTKPMTCAKIAEGGFKCPKLEQGGCDCKSPAALAFKPLSTDELLAALNSFEKLPTAIENIQTAQQFIKEYLYNIDAVTAETLINYNVKARFDFKATDLKNLIALHRDIHKAYRESKETRQAASGNELPDWYEVTDKGGLRFLPGALADHMAKNVDAFFGAANYYFYEHGVYEPRDDIAAFAKARSFMVSRSAKSAEISDAERQWRSIICKPIREINANPFIVNVKNGLYNLLDGSFKEHTPDYHSTVQINANYDPNADCPQFLSFLADILPDSEHSLIQEIMGYLLIPVNKAQKSFVFVGAANAGKSTLLSIAQDVLLGAENVSNIPWQYLGERFNKAELFGKLANIFADLPSKAIDDNGIFKSLTGEDAIQGERKGKDPFYFRPYARMLFSCNDIPKNLSDRSDGFYRKLIIIRFDKSVPMERRDPNLRERIACERDGILSWALEGVRRLIANSYIFSETGRTKAELQKYKVESNSVLTFVDEYCEVGSGFIAREALYQRYKDFCHEGGLRAMSQTRFNAELEGNFTEIHRGQDKLSTRKVWRGITFVDGGKE